MSGTLIDLGLRRAAITSGQTVARTDTRRVTLEPTAKLISILAMTGDHAGLWGVSVGTANHPRPHTLIVGDPRYRENQEEVWRFLSREIADYADQCAKDGTHPQILVATPAAWDTLVAAAERFAYLPDTTVRRAAEAIVVLGDRSRIAGQQSVIVATTVFAEHLITPGEADRERYLTTWARHTGAPTALLGDDDDDDVTVPPRLDIEGSDLVRKITRLENLNPDSREARTRGAGIANDLNRILRERHARLAHAARTIAALPQTRLPELAKAADQDAREWARWSTRAAAGRGPTGRRSIRNRVITLVEREQAAATMQTACWAHDDLECERGIADGRVLRGTVTTRSPLDQTITVVLDNPNARARIGAKLVDRTNHRALLTITDLWVGDQGLTVTMSTPKKHVPGLGPIVTIPNPPTGSAVPNAIRQFAHGMPWTHSPTPDTVEWGATAPPQARVPDPPLEDPLARANALRAQ